MIRKVGLILLGALALAACSGSTTPATNVIDTSATLNGNAGDGTHNACDANNGDTCTMYWRYRKVGNSSWTNVGRITGIGYVGPGPAPMHIDISGLTAATQYEYQLCGNESSYGQDFCVGASGVSQAHASTDTTQDTQKFTTNAVYPVPSTVAKDCSADVTSALTTFIGTVPNNSTIRFAANGCYRLDGTLDLSGRTGLDFEGQGSTFKRVSAPGDQDALWRITGSTSMKLNAMTLDGDYPTPGTFNANVQHAHGVDLRGTAAELSNITARNLGGDCVYFGLGSDNQTRSSGSFHDSSCTGTSRNGVSVTAANNVLVQHDSVNTIGFETFDVEPNIASGNWGASNVTFDSNTTGTYRSSVYAFTVIENAPISGVTFSNNTVTGQGLKAFVGPTTSVVSRPQNVSLTGNSSNTAQSSPAMQFDSVDGLTATGNTVPMASGTMATVRCSTGVNISGNTFTGGSSEFTVLPCG